VSTAEESSGGLLALARAGDQDALGEVLEGYRQYLRLLAGSRVGKELRARFDPSDLVQETLLEAHRDFPQFQGENRAELAGWLRQILLRNLADQCKHHQSQKRDVGREQPLESKRLPEYPADGDPDDTPLVAMKAPAVLKEQWCGADDDKAAAILRMRTLNRAAAEALQPIGPHAVTDVTGFGLF